MGYIRFKTSHLILLPMETYLLYILHMFWLILHYTFLFVSYKETEILLKCVRNQGKLN